MGDYEAAHTYFMKTLGHQIFRTPTEYAVVLHNAANSCTNLLKYTEARKHAEEALSIFEETLPPNHSYICATRQLLDGIEAVLREDIETV